MTNKLAIFGGEPVLKKDLPITNNIGKEEKEAVLRVLESGKLSGFLGQKGLGFFGGEKVKELEEEFKRHFGCKHAISYNSATTALQGAVAALDLEPGSEVIVSPYTMSASATAILMSNLVPVFADIDPNSFCITLDSIKKNMTPKTKAIIYVNIFGGSGNIKEICDFAKENNLKVIEDNAQAPKAMYKDKFLGTYGDLGIFSFNVHKTMQAGEGGVIITNDDRYAFRSQLIRNHGEVVIDEYEDKEFLLGSNYRMSEIHAAICIEQLKKVDFLNDYRIDLANYLTESLKEIEGLKGITKEDNLKHVYYLYPIIFDKEKIGMSRELFAKAMKAEGFELNVGYVKPIYLYPIYQNKRIYKNSRIPFGWEYHKNEISYERGICPVAERMHYEDLLLCSLCRYPVKKEHIDLFIKAIKKVIKNRWHS